MANRTVCVPHHCTCQFLLLVSIFVYCTCKFLLVVSIFVSAFFFQLNLSPFQFLYGEFSSHTQNTHNVVLITVLYNFVLVARCIALDLNNASSAKKRFIY